MSYTDTNPVFYTGHPVIVTLSRERLGDLRKLLDGMQAWSNRYLNEKGYVDDDLLGEYDEGMTDWREDVANAAEALTATIQEQNDDR
jgi:hypothetical protein